jgi:ABC-type multidrug transport system permease subunit
MIKLFRKDLILFFNDPRSYTLTFLIPIILITLFAFAYGGIEKYQGKPDTYKLLISDNDKTDLSGRFISALDSVSSLEVLKVDIDEARRLVTNGSYSGALFIHNGFMDSLLTGSSLPVELLYDKEQSFEAGVLQSITVNVLFSYTGAIKRQNTIDYLVMKGIVDPDLFQYITSSVSNNSSELKMSSIVGEKRGQNLGLIQAVAGTAILMLLFSVAGIGTSILEERENGTINRLLFSPLSLRTILYSKMLFAFSISILQLSVMFLFSWLFLNLDITINPEALVLMILSTAFAVSSLGIFLAAIAKSRQQALSLSTLIILVMSAIGGSMIPLFIMPDVMRNLAYFSVNYWSIQGFYDIFWRTLPLSDIIPKILLLSGVGIIFTIISLRLFSKNIFKII